MKTLFKIILTFTILLISISIFASNYRKVTQKQYFKWAKTVKLFVYNHSVQCPSLHNAILIHNDLVAHNYRSASYRINDMQCNFTFGSHPISIIKTYGNGKIYLVTVGTNERDCDTSSIQHSYKKPKCTNTYSFDDHYIMGWAIHNIKELKNKYMKEK